MSSADIILEPFEIVSCSKCGQPCDVQGFAPFDRYHCPSCGAEWLIPARFANFIVLEQLGKGGMGAVYRAYDETLGRTVALKVMQRSIGSDRAFVDQFLQEARALAAINSPNIVQIYSYGEENGQPYIVMELVDGDRLDHIHAKKHALDEKFVLQVAIQVCRGMQASAAAGMTHGDIKPANILFDSKGNAKVSDFGLARLKGERPKPGEIWGTPYYVSPEVVRGQAPSAASDIYSLGGTLYHVLTGEPPFNGETVNDTVLLRFKEPAPDPRTFKPSVSAPTAAILLRMLEADTSLRYPNYESVIVDLERALAAYEEAHSPHKKKTEASKIVGILVAGVLALVFLGIIAFVVIHVVRSNEEKAREQAQFEKDKREGRLVQRIVGGKVQWVRASRPPTPSLNSGTDKSASAAKPGATATAPAAANTDDLSLAAAADLTIRPAGASAKDDPKVLALCAGNGEKSAPAKIYLQFKLPRPLPLKAQSAKLSLTAKNTTKKPNAPSYQVRLWALRDDAAFPEFAVPSDDNAPAAIPGNPSALDEGRAILLGEFPLPSNPETGDEFSITSPALLDFVTKYQGETLTLVLTGDPDTDHRSGWRFTSSEDGDRFRPPTLRLSSRFLLN